MNVHYLWLGLGILIFVLPAKICTRANVNCLVAHSHVVSSAAAELLCRPTLAPLPSPIRQEASVVVV